MHSRHIPWMVGLLLVLVGSVAMGGNIPWSGTFTLGSNFNPPATDTVTVDPAGATAQANNKTVTFDDANQLLGSGLLTFHQTGYGMTVHMSASQPGFSGGMALTNASRQATLNATAAGALGTGALTVNEYWNANYTFGAGSAGVVANDGGQVFVSGTVTPGDSFTINAYGAIGGASAELAKLSRNGATPALAPVTLAPNAVVLHSTVSAASVANLGTAADLYYGLNSSFNSAAFALTIGAGTPWKGIANPQGRGSYAANDTVLQKGTITVDDGGGSVGEVVLMGRGTTYYSDPRALAIGKDADSPTFVAAAGKVDARIMGHVKLDSTAPALAGAFDKFLVSAGGLLTVNKTAGMDGLPATVESGGQIAAGAGDAFDGDVTVQSGGTLLADRPLNGAGTLVVQASGSVRLTVADGLTGTQGAAAVEAGAKVRWFLDDPQDLDQTAPGTILQYYATNQYNHRTFGAFVGNGHILVNNADGWYGNRAILQDSAAGGISGSLTISCAPSSHASHDGNFRIQENFLPGAVVQIGHLDPGFTVDGDAQTGYVILENTSNAMATIRLAGAGVNGGTVFSTHPTSFESAAIEFILPMAVDAGGSRMNIPGNKTDPVDMSDNPITVVAGARGIVYNSIYQGTRTVTLGDLTLEANSRLDVIKGYNCKYAYAGDVHVGTGALLALGSSGGALVLPTGAALGGHGTINVDVTFGDPGGYDADFDWSLGADPAGPGLLVSADLTLDAFTLRLADAGGEPDPGTDYVLLRWSGAGPTALDYVIDYGLTDWFGASLSVEPGQIVMRGLEGLQDPIGGLIPEPATMALLALGALVTLRRKR